MVKMRPYCITGTIEVKPWSEAVASRARKGIRNLTQSSQRNAEDAEEQRHTAPQVAPERKA